MDLTARHPRTGDLQREVTYDGLRADETKGSKGGRRPAVVAAKTGDVRAAYLEGPLHHPTGGHVANLLAVLQPKLVRSVLALNSAHGAQGAEVA